MNLFLYRIWYLILGPERKSILLQCKYGVSSPMYLNHMNKFVTLVVARNALEIVILTTLSNFRIDFELNVLILCLSFKVCPVLL